jgi:DHA1 family multidrug resistance protein-like MFS transporter
MLGFGLVMPLLPLYASDFGATGIQLGLLTGSFAITRMITTFLGGWLADKVGRKTPVIVGLLAYSIVMTLYGFSRDVNQLILLRGLQGLVSGIVWPVINVMVADIALPEDRSKAMSLYEMALFLGRVIGPVLGGVLADVFTKAVPFFFCGILAFLSMILVALNVQETFRNKGTIKKHQTKSKYTLNPNSGISTNNSFLSKMTPYPRTFLGLCIAGLIVSFSSSLIQPVLSVFAEEKLGISVAGVGVLFSVIAATMLITTLPIGTIADRRGRKPVFIFGKIVDAISTVLIILSGGFWPLLLVMMLRGFGRAASNPSITAMFSNIVPASRRGKGMGIFNVFRNIGLVIGSTIGGFLWDVSSTESPFIACSIVTLVGVIIALLTVSEPKKGLK